MTRYAGYQSCSRFPSNWYRPYRCERLFLLPVVTGVPARASGDRKFPEPPGQTVLPFKEFRDQHSRHALMAEPDWCQSMRFS